MADRAETLIVDYGMGNLRSVEKALSAVGGRPRISADAEAVRRAGRLVLPGVGAFGDAMANLERAGLDEALREAARAGTPLLGLCLGLQLLFTHSEEFGSHRGLGLIPGHVRSFRAPGLRVPHIGWNQVEDLRPDPLFRGIADGSYFYFVHSLYVEPDAGEHVLARTVYGHPFCSVAGRDNVRGAQFHPEKSHDIGKRLLENFLAI